MNISMVKEKELPSGFVIEFSKVSLNYAEKRDCFIDCFEYRKDNDYILIRIAPNSCECSDGGLYFRVYKYEDYEWVAEFSEMYLDGEDGDKELIKKELDRINNRFRGEKEMRKFIGAVSKHFVG